MECLLIADDLTGACDAAVQFAGGGHRVAVSLTEGAGAPDAEVLAIDTESRGLSIDASCGAILQAARQYAAMQPRILFKKIDSTLRGNAGVEIAATAEAFECDMAVITPAFPAMQRIVVGGWLHVYGPAEFEPIDLVQYFRAQGLTSHRHCNAGGLAAGESARYISVDASCDADLDSVVRMMKRLPSRILWAGSAGLAAALARSIPPPGEKLPLLSPLRAAVLFCIGSTHPATVAQQRCLLAERPVSTVAAETAELGEIAEALRAGRNVMLEVPRGLVPQERLAELLNGAREVIAALALSGGDTASHVCRALHAHAIELHDEVQAGIPWGTLRGGEFDGVAVVTKSGGFGDSHALVEIADFFTCPKT